MSQRDSLEGMARAFATKAHGEIDRRRKYTGEAYIEHPAAVAEIVRSVPHTEAMLCAAWLHDVVEDTPRTLSEVFIVFGHEVGSLVEMLTDVSKPTDGNRAARKALDLAHTATASPAAKTVKLADIIDNSRTIFQYDPDFSRVYKHEISRVLAVLTEGDPTLYAQASSIIAKAMEGSKR